MTTTDHTHLDALELRLSHERQYLRDARSDNEADLRRVWISQIESEIIQERKHLGLCADELPDMTDDELLDALSA